MKEVKKKVPCCAQNGKYVVGAFLVLILALALAACGGGSSDSSSSSTGASSESTSTETAGETESGSSSLAAFEEKVDKIVAERTAEQTKGPPETGPPAAKDKTVYVVACSQALEGCARESKSAVEAGEKMGWNMTLFDTESKPDKMVEGVDQAINNNADGILVQAIDMATLAAPLEKAKQAGAKIICFACVNHNDIASQVIPSSHSFYEDGYDLAAEMYKNTEGHPKIVMISNKEIGVIGNRQKGTEAFVEDCKAAGGDCEIVSTQYLLFANLTQVPELVAGSLQQNPDANSVWMAFDSVEEYIQQGVEEAGVTKENVGLYGFDGNEANIANMRAGGWEVASMAGPFEWVGWAEIDGLNRLFNGEKPVENVIVAKMITPENLPKTDVYDGDVEYQPAYLKSWGVE